MQKISLGTGVFTWNANERRSDRYGSVYLIDEGYNSLTEGKCPSRIDEVAANAYEGQKGQLLAVIKQTRESTHIGDMFHGIGPRTPECGQVICLGEGELFCVPSYDGGIDVGLKPANGRKTQWLKIRALYDCHEQSVELFFHPK